MRIQIDIFADAEVNVEVKKEVEGRISVVMPNGLQCLRKASIARLEPIDFVQPMSKIAYKGFAARLIPSTDLGKDQRQSGTCSAGENTDRFMK